MLNVDAGATTVNMRSVTAYEQCSMEDMSGTQTAHQPIMRSALHWPSVNSMCTRLAFLLLDHKSDENMPELLAQP